jgi:hypothetical protein
MNSKIIKFNKALKMDKNKIGRVAGAAVGALVVFVKHKDDFENFSMWELAVSSVIGYFFGQFIQDEVIGTGEDSIFYKE